MPEKLQENIENRPGESQKTPESELSPEVLGKVMKKVKDINEESTAYTRIAQRTESNRIRSILQHGVLGGQPEIPRERIEWTKALKQKGKGHKAAPVFFNIIGRTLRDFPGSAGGFERFDGFRGYYPGIVLIFDISKFREVGVPLGKDFGEGENRLSTTDTAGWEAVLEPYTYWAPRNDDPTVSSLPDFFKKIGITPEQEWAAWQPGSDALKKAAKEFPGGISKDGHVYVNSEYGFVLAYRISPKLFKGFVVSSEEELTATVNALLEESKEDKELLVPIYDVYGNLLWPKKMNYEEVKKFVEERDRNKEKK